MKYIVKLSYHYFVFFDAKTAIEFAETAKMHYYDKRDDDLDVEINIVFAEPEEVESQEEEE